MSLSSLFNLPSAPAQLLAENGSAAQNSANASNNSAPQGDAFATYMAQQMSKGQFSNWQNLTSALANQNALGSNALSGFGHSSSDQTAGFGPAHSAASLGNESSTQSAQSSSSSSDTSSSSSSNSSSDSSSTSSTSQASNYAAYRRLHQLNSDQTLLGDSIDSVDSTAIDASGTNAGAGTKADSSNGTQAGGSLSTNAWLMSASTARSSNQDTTAAGNNSASTLANLAKNGSQTSNTLGTLPVVLPSIGAALQAQQNAAKTQANLTSTDSKGAALKTTSLSDKVQLITPNQADTNPQSLVSFAKDMGLNDSQIQQLFGSDAAKALANNAQSSSTQAGAASTADIIGSGAGSGAALASSTTAASTNTLSTGAFSTHGLISTDAATGSLSPVASSVLGQVSNLQVQIDQAPGAIGIQSDATATTLADLSAKELQSVSGASALKAPGVSGAGASSATPVSSLEILSEMDASLRPEDLAALEAHFTNTDRTKGAFSFGTEKSGFTIDMNTALNTMGTDGSGAAATLGNTSDNSGTGSNAGSGSNGESNSQQNNSNLPADMAGAYEKLSNKFADEVSNRLQQQFAQGQWKMKFALRPTSLGIVDIQLEMKDGKLAANFQSNNPLTQHLIQNNSHQLRNALQGSGIAQSSVQVGSGQTNGQGSNSGQNSGVPYTYQSNPLNAQAAATEEIPPADDLSITKSSKSDSQLDIFA